MPSKLKHPCSKPGCPRLTINRFCTEHEKQDRKEADTRRLPAHERGYDHKWHQASKRYLKENPLCEECAKEGIDAPARCVDHITPHKGDMVKFWNQDNWQGLCFRHHSIKTAKEDGGFGNNGHNRD